MATNFDLLKALNGKQGEIARALYAGNLSDEEIASQNKSTAQYVQNIKSLMRKHGFDLPKYRSPFHSRSNGFKGALHENEMILVDRISREDTKIIYTLLQKGTQLTQVAVA